MGRTDATREPAGRDRGGQTVEATVGNGHAAPLVDAFLTGP